MAGVGSALEALQEAAEAYLVLLFRDAYFCRLYDAWEARDVASERPSPSKVLSFNGHGSLGFLVSVSLWFLVSGVLFSEILSGWVWV